MFNFNLDEEEIAKLNDWLNTRKPGYSGAIDGRYTYSFTPTNLGMVITVEDNLEKGKIDLTDYESW